MIINSFNIIECNYASKETQELDGFLRQHWPDQTFFPENIPTLKLPLPLMVREPVTGEIIAGLVYTLYPSPEDDQPVIWLNGLYVVPEWRKRGIASQLIQRSVEAIGALGQASAYVYTDIPKLYQNLGWITLSCDHNQQFYVLTVFCES